MVDFGVRASELSKSLLPLGSVSQTRQTCIVDANAK
jgi:hypothetical protein